MTRYEYWLSHFDGALTSEEIRGVYDRNPWLLDAYPLGEPYDDPLADRFWAAVRTVAFVLCVVVWGVVWIALAHAAQTCTWTSSTTYTCYDYDTGDHTNCTMTGNTSWCQ